MIDTHAHLFLEEIKGDITQVIDNARAAGVKAFILPNVDSKTIHSLLEVAEQFPNECFPCVGIHPTSVKDNVAEEIKLIEKFLQQREFIAIGEIGIDLYWDKSHLQEQCLAFDLQIKLALKYNMPIIVHTRQSFDETYEIVDKYKDSGLKGVFHCFSGNAEQGQKLIDLGFMLGIGGVVTYKNSGLDKALKQLPLQNIVLETDSPYLPPVPYRGQRNEPAYIKFVAEKLSEVYDVSFDTIVETTTANAKKLFNLKTL